MNPVRARMVLSGSRTVGVVAIGLSIGLAGPLALNRPADYPPRVGHAGPAGRASLEALGRDIEVFPGASRDPVETAALGGTASRTAVYRTTSGFDVVVNYYRYKRKQGVHVSEEDLSLRFERMAAAIERGVDPVVLEADSFAARFHAHVASGSRDLAGAWRTLARRHTGRVQRIGEGQRVTIYRPWISRQSFTLIDDTVILLTNRPEEEVR